MHCSKVNVIRIQGKNQDARREWSTQQQDEIRPRFEVDAYSTDKLFG